MPEIRAENLAVARGDRTILSALNFSAAGGQALRIDGRNGSGKTSLLEVLAGLRAPASGVLLGLPEPGQIHWLGHRPSLSLALTPLENLRFWCGVQGLREDRCFETLADFGVPHPRTRPCRLLSAGQRRRVALARLQLESRDLWLLDEPLAALDAEGIERFGALLRAHLERGGCAVVSSHQPLPAATAATLHLP